MRPKNKQDDSSADSDSDYKPSRPNNSPPAKRRMTIRACRKRGVSKKPDNEILDVQFPEEVDKTKFLPEIINASLGFDSVGGLEETIAMLKRDIIVPMEHRKTFEKKCSFVQMKGIIFHGPPGTGKTLLAKAMAAELSRIAGRKYTFYYRKGPDLLSRYVGDSETNVKLIFDVAKANKPAIVFFDELDAFCSKRSDTSENRHESSVVCAILTQLDCVKCGEVLVIGATNRLESIDPALRREGRFDTEIKFSNPNQQGRKEILMVHYNKWEKVSHPNDDQLDDLAKRTAGFTGADLKGLCKCVMRCALARKIPNLAQADKQTIRKQLKTFKVMPVDWDNALRKRRPTNVNVFGNQDFAGIQIDPSLEPIIGGIKNEITEWIQDIWSPETTTGFSFATIWSESEDYVEDIDNFILPSALTDLIGNNRKLILMTQDKLEPTEMTKILDGAGNSSLSTLIYFPRLDIMDDNLKIVLAKSLKKYTVLRIEKPAFLVIGSALRGINELGGPLIKLFSIPPLVFEVRRPSDREVKTFFTPALKICGKQTQKLLGQIVNAARESDITNISKLKTALSRQGANIESLIQDFRRLICENPVIENDNDSGNEEASEYDDDSDEGGESDSEIEE